MKGPETSKPKNSGLESGRNQALCLQTQPITEMSPDRLEDSTGIATLCDTVFAFHVFSCYDPHLESQKLIRTYQSSRINQQVLPGRLKLLENFQ